ncbi:MAG: hypothetical protein RL033_1385 [Pseudomonadota bacterium]
MDRLAQLGHAAELASVGDPVDFTVSVASVTTGSSGRLERQTAAGQMAIRNVSAPTCEQVVEGLALSLDLALGPEPAAAPVLRPWSEELSFGLAATLATGVAPGALPGLALFAEVGRTSSARLRLEARAARGESEGRAGVALEVTLLGGRLQGCPLALVAGDWSWAPCVALSLGRLWAEGAQRSGRADAGLWASAGASSRVDWQLGRTFALGFELGAALPLVRYQMGAAEDAPLYRTRAFGLELALGVALALP